MARRVIRQLDDSEELRRLARRAPLGSRLAARFRRIGLTEEISELRGQPARPATFEPVEPDRA